MSIDAPTTPSDTSHIPPPPGVPSYADVSAPPLVIGTLAGFPRPAPLSRLVLPGGTISFPPPPDAVPDLTGLPASSATEATPALPPGGLAATTRNTGG